MLTLLRRIRDAAAILLGLQERLPATKQDLLKLTAEFHEWEQTMTGILEKLNAWYARQAKREKRLLEAGMFADEEGGNGEGPPPGPVGEDSKLVRELHKAELRKKAAALRAGTGIIHIPGR